MKKIVFFVALTVVLSLSAGKGFAIEKCQAEIIEESAIEKLVFDPTRQPPDYKILPPPAPTPFIKEAVKEKDNRSWTASEYRKIIDSVSKKYDIDPQVIYATIMTESNGNTYAFRYEPGIKDASLGLGQILISTARSLGFTGNPKEIYKPEVSIDLIGKYHRNMLDTYGKLSPVRLAIAYNAGSPWNRAVPGHIFRFQKWMNEEEVYTSQTQV